MTTSLTIRRGSFFAALLAIIAGIMLMMGSSASSALPGKFVAADTETQEAYLAKPRIWSTSPNGCFDTFSEPFYPCLRIKRPSAVWIVGYYSDGVGWEFGSSGTPGWTIRCGKGRRVGSREQVNRDGLAEGEFFVNQKVIRLPLPMRQPSWCEVNVETDSPYYLPGYELWWDYEMVINAKVQIRATSRRR